MLASVQLRAVAAVCSPEFALDEDETALAHQAVDADEGLRPAAHGPSSGRDAFAGHENPEGGDREPDADDEAGVDPVRRWGVAEEERQADAEADQAADGQHTVRGRM